MKLKQPFYAPDEPGAAGGGVADALSSAIMNKIATAPAPAPTHPFEQSQTVYSRVNGQTVALPVDVPVIPQPVPDPVQPPTPEAPPVPATPAQPVAPDPTEGGKYIIVRNPENGQIITRVKNDPDYIADFIGRDKLFIKQLKELPQPQVIQPPVQPQPTTDDIRVKTLEKARLAAQRHYSKIDPTINVDPIAETLTDLLLDARNEIQGEFKQTFESQQRAQALDRELYEVQAEDPTFQLDSPEILALREEFKTATPREIQEKRIYRQFMQFRRNQPPPTPANPAPVQQPTAPAQTQQPPAVPNDMWRTPGGSSQTATYDAHPEVVKAIELHKKTWPLFGKQVTTESIARVRQTMINDIMGRAAQARGEMI